MAKQEDSLAHAVRRIASRVGTAVLMCGDPEIVDAGPQSLAFKSVICAGRRVRASDIAGVLCRLPACWWSAGYSGVYQERIGAWYTLLCELPCPVVNRFGLSWWLDQEGYALQLSLYLNAALTNTRQAAAHASGPAAVYMVGPALIPGSGESRFMADRLRGDVPVLRHWQNETGVVFAKLTFGADRAKPVAVDPCPDCSAESAEITGQLADAVYSMLMRSLS
ncbi:MAG TPA: hypothetical protein VFL57_15520 [Bryobacteraceae bacterium]|nr:hypothetical protein [Bryobacteraceae bacterium]